jgi:hypothetical protein
MIFYNLKTYNIINGYIISIEYQKYNNIDDYLIKKKLQDELVKRIKIVNNI